MYIQNQEMEQKFKYIPEMRTFGRKTRQNNALNKVMSIVSRNEQSKQNKQLKRFGEKVIQQTGRGVST